ncbi:hypothetical protein [Thermaurantiacus sp.]
MIGEFLLRLAVALPIVLLLAVASLWAVRRGWLRLPGANGPGPSGFPAFGKGRILARPVDGTGLELVATRGIQPGIQLLLLRHAGQELLVGVSPQGLALLSAQPLPVAASSTDKGDGA